MMNRNQKFEESKIYKFNDCDTIYIPKGYTLQEAIDWYTSEYDSIDNDILSEVNYLDGFWDSDVPRERAYEIYKDNPSNFDMYDLSKDKKVQEGTIEYRFGDLYIFKTFKTAKEENDKLNSEIFIICSTEF